MNAIPLYKIMTINDQIKDEKLQYDINIEAAKIWTLVSGKIHKYEYLTVEDILPSNQQQIIKQVKFTYSPLGKAFEKRIKAIEDQGKKQVDALENLKDTNKQVVNINDYYEIYNKRLNKIEELIKKIDDNNLIFTVLSTRETIDFTRKNDALTLLKKIRNGKITLERAKQLQEDLNNTIKKIRKRNKAQE